MVSVGEKAPDFVLKDSDENDVSLQSLLGDKSILLYFYHKDWSPVCTKQLTGFSEMHDQLADIGVKIVAISADHTSSHKAFKDKLGSNFALLSGTKDVMESYGVYMPNGCANRAYFVLDKDGVIKFMTVMPNPGQMMENEVLINLIKDLKQKMSF